MDQVPPARRRRLGLLGVASLLLSTAVVVSVGAAYAATRSGTTHPITVCVNKTDRSVTEPSSGQCMAHGQKTVHLASAQDVVSLAERVAAVEQGLATQGSALNQLRGMFVGKLTLTAAADTATDFYVSAGGELLRPNAKVKFHATNSKDETTSTDVGVVDETGHVAIGPIDLPCGAVNIYFTSIDLNGGAVSTLHQPSGPGCP